MKVHKCTKISFIALGQEHQVYTDSYDVEYFGDEVSKICPTSRVVKIEMVMIDYETFHKNNLENLVKWNNDIFNRFNATGEIPE